MNDCAVTTGTLTRALDGDTPTLRLFGLLEVIAGEHRRMSLQRLVERTGLPKPTLHRMLLQLESAGILRRESDGRNWTSAARLRRLAESLLINDTLHGARHRVLAELVAELGETCNITALSGSDVIYLDRVETDEPLRISLQAGSRVPMHCSASGKLLLAQLPPAQRRRLLDAAPLERHTGNTVTDVAVLSAELDHVQRVGYAIDNEEFLAGLFCVAVLVPARRGRSNLCVAVQAPVMRLPLDKATRVLPALRRAAQALGRIEADDEADDEADVDDGGHGDGNVGRRHGNGDGDRNGDGDHTRGGDREGDGTRARLPAAAGSKGRTS